ncbi:MAG TPA: hypothetical protein VHZ26_11210 [Caulobacteraceae bacterium]|jgi:hypothetical protein|nr:hypothetical protein [Caulobacteraceae bacterium]
MALALPPPICASTPAYTVDLDVNITAPGNPPTYTITPHSGANANVTGSHLVDPTGNLTFSDTNMPVAMIFELNDTSGAGYTFDTNPQGAEFSFAKDYPNQPGHNPSKTPAGSHHYQIQNIVPSHGNMTVTACYLNTQGDPSPAVHAIHVRSQYGLNLRDSDGHASAIDPGVGNGTNKMYRRPHHWRPHHWRHYHRSWLRHHHHHRAP